MMQFNHWIKVGHHIWARSFFRPVLTGSAVLGLFMLFGCVSMTAPPLPSPPAARGPAPTFAAVARAISRMPTRYQHNFFATLKLDHHQISMIGRLNLISAANFQITAADEFGRLLFMVRRQRPHLDVVQAAAGLPRGLAVAIAQDVVIALLPPKRPLRRPGLPVPRTRPHLHAVTLSYTDMLGNTHHGLFVGAQGHLRRADITLTNHGRLQVLYTCYNAAGCPRTLLIRQPGDGWLLMLNFTGSHS